MRPAPPEDAAAARRGATWEGAAQGLRERVEEAFARWRHRPDSLDRLGLRLTHPAPAAAAADWLRAQDDPVRLYWRGRGEVQARAAIGAADRARGAQARDFGAVLARCRRDLPPGARYYGGFAFDDGAEDDPGWQEFGPAQFWLPRFEFLEGEDRGQLACNLILRADAPEDAESVLEALDRLPPPRAGDPAIPAILDRRDAPDPDAWEAMVLSALQLIRDGALEKIVLARRAVHRFAAPVNPADLIARLARVTSNCFHFLLQPAAGSAFLGTTPERLCQREGRHLHTEVIAGTRPRDADPAADAALREDLLNSEKDQREHEVVRRFLRQRLHLLADESAVQAQATVLRLERKQHLYSAARARLRPGVDDDAVLAALHPTPAVGGAPAENARAEIRRLEPFRRGWYAAPVGWIGADACEFAVAIRSGLVRGDTVAVYSGAGIVEGSVPSEEWAEIEHKIADFRKVAGPATPARTS